MLLTALFIGSANLVLAQAPAFTADSYVAPYSGDYQYGSNMGYYANGWTDEGVAGLIQKAGGHSIRPSLPESFVEQYSYDVRKATFAAYGSTYGMKELTCFIGGPSVAHTDNTVYGSSPAHSKLFANLYQPIWNADGSVNASNYYAIYVYRLLLTYGSMVKFWEVVNEPDYPGANTDPANWLTRAPLPAEQANTFAPFYHYVRMLRITYEVVKKYHPEAYITTGGLGYSQYADALLRYTDNPADGSVSATYPRTGGAYFDVMSFHNYPSYSLHYWDNSISGFRYNRTSDYAAAQVITAKNEFQGILKKYGYDGTTHPTKLFILTETNVARRTCADRTGSDDMQRSFGIKVQVLAQKNDIKQFYLFSAGETVNAPAVGATVSAADEFNLMGLYQNLTRDAPGAAKLTGEGQAISTASRLLYGYDYDATRTAALNLPSTVEGGAFVKDGSYRYVLWAKAQTDNSEWATATYNFPSSLALGNLLRYEWSYSIARDSTTLSSQGIALSASPSFFVPATSGAPTTPTTTTPTTPSTGVCTATGTILREQWNNIGGSLVSAIPTGGAASSTSQLTQLEATTTGIFNYGARVRGYVCVPQTGSYTFYIVSDDGGELWLSTDDTPAKKVRLATCTAWTSGIHDWYRSASQQSAPVPLVAGQRYYLEVLHKQSWGSGYLSVAWKLPNGTMEAPIPGLRLSPYVPGSPAARPASALAAKPTRAPAGAELTAFPNPFGQQTTVRFALDAAGAAALALYDLQGRLVRQLYQDELPAGTPQEITINRDQLGSGLYLLRLTTPTGVLTSKLVVE